MSRMPRAAAVPSMPACSSMRSSRSGRNTSMPSIRMTSRAPRSIWPAWTRHAPTAKAAAAPMAMPASVMPRPIVLAPRSHIVLWKSSWLFRSSKRARSPLWPNAFSVARPWRASSSSAPNAERGVVRDHRARVLDERASGDHGRDGGDRQREVGEPGAGEDAGEEPAEQREPRDAQHDADQAERRRGDDARAQADGEVQELAIEVHASAEV